ncbi:MAG: DUF3325 domain-containing protein [Pseudomonadota bacterium]
MPEALVQALWLAAGQGCALAGFGWLALTMDTHWDQVRGPQPAPAPTARPLRILRVLGALGLAASLGCALMADHPTMAALVWIMAMALGALATAFTLAWRPAALRVLVAWA